MCTPPARALSSVVDAENLNCPGTPAQSGAWRARNAKAGDLDETPGLPGRWVRETYLKSCLISPQLVFSTAISPSAGPKVVQPLNSGWALASL